MVKVKITGPWLEHGWIALGEWGLFSTVVCVKFTSNLEILRVEDFSVHCSSFSILVSWSPPLLTMDSSDIYKASYSAVDHAQTS